MEDTVFEFNKRIIDATQDLCVAYKLILFMNVWELRLGIIKKTVDYISDDAFLIADAKEI